MAHWLPGSGLTHPPTNGADPLSATLDDVLAAIGDLHVAQRVDAGHVPRGKPALTIDLEEVGVTDSRVTELLSMVACARACVCACVCVCVCVKRLCEYLCGVVPVSSSLPCEFKHGVV